MCIPPGRPCARQQRRFETAGPLRRTAAAPGHWSGQAPAVEQQMKADPDRVFYWQISPFENMWIHSENLKIDHNDD